MVIIINNKSVVKTTISGKVNYKKFKSGQLINRIKNIITHPILNIPAYSFYDDDSYVECRRCRIINPIIYEIY